ncbi:hypothetical protein ABNH60_003548 [Salmonella enterica]
MNPYILLPSDIGGDIRVIDTMLPGNTNILLLPGDVISVSSVKLPMKFRSGKKRLRFVLNNLSADIPFDSQNDEVIFLSTPDTEQGFFIVNSALWHYWLQLRETLTSDQRNAPLLPDWMLLPVPQCTSAGLSIEIKGRLLYRRTRWQGTSLPAISGHHDSVPNRLSLHILPRNRQRFENERHFAIVRHYDVFKKIMQALNSQKAICLLLIFLIMQNSILVAEDYALWLQTPSESHSESYFQPSWFKLQKFSETTPFYLTFVHIHSHEFSVSLDSRTDCQVLITQALQFFPQSEIRSRERVNDKCSITLTQRQRVTG